MTTTDLYLAYIDIYQFYTLLDIHNIQFGTWRIEKTEPILTDFIRECHDQLPPTYIYHTQYISYASMIKILDDIYSFSVNKQILSNITSMFIILKKLSTTFPNIYNHVNFTQSI